MIDDNEVNFHRTGGIPRVKTTHVRLGSCLHPHQEGLQAAVGGPPSRALRVAGGRVPDGPRGALCRRPSCQSPDLSAALLGVLLQWLLCVHEGGAERR